MRTITEQLYYDEVLSNDKPTVIDFGASWCQPCKQTTQILSEIEPIYQDQIDFVAMDVEGCQDVCQQLGVRSIPTLVLIKEGQPAGFLVGAQGKSKIESFLQG